MPVSDAVVKIGASYAVGGARYTPADMPRHDETGLASWYGEELRGSRTANGERFDPDGVSAAHRTLPMPSYVEVTSLDTGRTILVRINDRGPFHSNRVIDLSIGAARQLGLTGHGATPVRVRRVDPPESDKLALQRGERVAMRSEPEPQVLASIRVRSGWTASARQTLSASMPVGPGPWFIQIAAFDSAARARSLAAHLGAQTQARGALHRVRLGPFATASEAQGALAPLAAKGYPDGQIVR